MERFKNIDFLRFLFALLIVHYHSMQIFRDSYNSLPFLGNSNVSMTSGYICTDFFFIISGFFLIAYFKKKSPEDISIWKVFCKKYLRLYPLIIFAFLCYGICSVFGIISFTPWHNILTLTTLQSLGIDNSYGNMGQAWFMSSLLWVSVFYAYLFKYFKKHFYLILSIIAVFSYAMLLNSNHSSLGTPLSNISYIFNRGLLRAFGGLSLGVFVFEFYNNFKTRFDDITPFYKTIITLFETGLFGFTVYEAARRITPFNDFILIIAFVVLFLLFLFNKGGISCLFECDLSVKLGRYAYSIFVMHMLCRDIFVKCVNCEAIQSFADMQLIIAAIMITSIIVGISTYHFVENPLNKYLKRKFKF